MDKFNIIIKIDDGDGSFINASRKNCPNSGEGNSFLACDMSSIFPYAPQVEINSVYVNPENRGKGIGRKLVEEIINMNKDAIILASAAALKIEYPEEPSDDRMCEIVESIRPFYEKMGFVDINILNIYETKIPFLYTGNPIGKYAQHMIFDSIAEKTNK